MRRVIITGANGFVGRHLVKELSKQGYEIWSVIRNPDEDISCIKKLNPNIVYCDLKNIDKLDEIILERGFDCFYHLAWAGSSGEGRKNYLEKLKRDTGFMPKIEFKKGIETMLKNRGSLEE